MSGGAPALLLAYLPAETSASYPPAMPPALPPGPRSRLLALAAYLRDPLGCADALARRYGDPFTLPGDPPIIATGHPAGIKAIYSADPDTFAPLADDMAVFLGATSLILVGGDRHRRLRRLLSPPFHGARMRAYGRAIVELTAARSATWRPGQVISAHAFAQRLTLDVILQVVFGVRDPAAMADLADRLTRLIDGISPLLALFPAFRRQFGGLGPFAAFTRRRRDLFAALDARIAEARAQPPTDDILSLLVHARDDDGAPLRDDELHDQLLLLVVAGHETTAIAIAWALDALHRPDNAAVLDRLRAELAPLGPTPDPDALAALPYLEAVANETLRRYPLAPAPAPRRLLRPLDLLGYTLPAGAAVAVAIGAAHLREDTYPDPLVFRPERFLGRTFSPFEFVPFGGGARRCLGAPLATYELRLCLGALLAARRLRLATLRPDPGRVRAANVGPAHGVPLRVDP